MTKERLNDMTEDDVEREGYPGMTVDRFLEKEFQGIERNTMVWVVKFALLTVI